MKLTKTSPNRGRREPIGGLARVAVSAMAAAVATVLATMAGAQPVEPHNGPKHVHPHWHALVHATLVPEPGKKVEDATIVLRDGFIVSVGSKMDAPMGARVWDCTGLTVYPGLIDPYVPIDSPKPQDSAPGRHWNARVMAERHALDGDGVTEKQRKDLRELGFTIAQVAPNNGIFRGQSAVVLLSEPDSGTSADSRVLVHSLFDVVSLESGGWEDRDYPNSKMGAIALVRQTLADAPWYDQALKAHLKEPAKFERPEANDSLSALNQGRAMLFDVGDEKDLLRVAKIAKEFNRDAVVVGSGYEFRRLPAVVDTKLPMIVPLTYPATPEIDTPGARESLALRDLMAWEQAPTNVRRLEQAGANLSITSSKRQKVKGKEESFHENLRKAIKHGLSEDDALAMLTTQPATILGLSDRAGKVQAGMIGNLVVVDGSLFDEKAEIRDVWVEGRRFEIKAPKDKSLVGEWTLDPAPGDEPSKDKGVIVIDKDNKLTLKRITLPETEQNGEGGDAKPKEKTFKPTNVSVSDNRVAYVIDAKEMEMGEGYILVSGIAEGDRMFGHVEVSGGKRYPWSATRTKTDETSAKEDAKEDGEDEESSDEESFVMPPEQLALPFGAYGYESLPDSENLVITNATIWTCGPEGIIREGALVVSDGRISYVGPDSKMPRPKNGVRTIDAAGKHITPGLIDCHSHTGIDGSVNEGSQAVTAEVRIFDVIDPDDIALYRELAGGLTAANQLHGSANPIGGQNSVIKLRWGVSAPDDMRVEGAIGGIKFALGENVKQSNWGERFTSRYPQTRMGVETLIRDRFTTAREYAKEKSEWEKSGKPSSKPSPRRDLELEALAEILAGQRLVHCHSYRQDEILMLCRVAADYGFKIGTFQHVLEGYKVAEAIKQNAIGGSSFSDWWAYKFEVYDAIPYNGAIMHDVGVVVSFNSDSDELARRMNTEASKAVKYGGVAPEEALKFVTLNAAKQLKIDDRTGSLEVSKDADFVIWSGDPLSSMSRCESTWIDGREYFSIEKDRALRDQAMAERERIIHKIIAQSSKKKNDKKDGADEKERGGDRPARDMVDSPPLIYEQLEREYDWLITNGFNPFETRCGDCGCSIHNAFTN